MSGGLVIRGGGRPGDADAIVDMWDRAIAWLVARGQAQQWGSEPSSTQPGIRDRVDFWLASPGTSIAEVDDTTVGASVLIGAAPPHIPPTPRSEHYLMFLISDRGHRGRGIGADLVREAAATARKAGSELLRVDCWAGAPDLVAFYERQGFVRSATFRVDVRGGWDGQVLEMEL